MKFVRNNCYKQSLRRRFNEIHKSWEKLFINELTESIVITLENIIDISLHNRGKT